MAGKKYIIGNPTLMAEWNLEKNNTLGLQPTVLTVGSEKKAWWICTKGHEWQAIIYNRKKRGCPICSNRQILQGYNDLLTLNPELAKEWNYEKNANLRPENFSVSSGKKVWWICKKGHEWQAVINNRNNGNGCPYCSGREVLIGYNDLQTINPRLASEWNHERNGDLSPKNFTSNSNVKVWWKCDKGHEWQAVISNRNNGGGCPICNAERHTSFPEYVLVYYLTKYNLEIIQSYKANGYELDIYVPIKKIAIEYDGYFWHKRKTGKDLAKNLKCQNDGIKLYRIREGLPPLNDTSIDYVIRKDYKDFEKIVQTILNEIIGCEVNIDIARDSIEIENLREYTEKKNSIAFFNPKIASEWHREKNGELKPENFSPSSSKKVWWKCDKGHEWQAIISNRSKGVGCPFCAGKKAIQGYNDLSKLNPELSRDWNYEKNSNLTPNMFTINSGKKVWWKCKKGHEWQARIADRNRGRGCPYCSRRKT